MKKSFRLTRSNDFKRVRRSGKSYAHPLFLLYAINNDQLSSRVGITANRRVGGAVKRNRAKRLLREAMRNLHVDLKPGYDLLLVSREALLNTNMTKICSGLAELFSKAKLKKLEPDEHSIPTR